MLLPFLCVLACYSFFGFVQQVSPTLGRGPRVPSRALARRPRDGPPPTRPTTDPIPLDIAPLVDNSPARNLVQDLQEAVPNLPSRYWLKNDNGMGMNKSCAKYPSLYQIRFNNGRWQTFDASNGTFYLFSAYYDNRTLAERPVVRVLGMLNRVDPKLNTSCQLWFNGTSKPVFAKVSEYKYIWNRAFGKYKNGVLQPYLLSCQVPYDYAHQVPESVSLVERPCDTATTNLRVVNNRPAEGQTKDFFHFNSISYSVSWDLVYLPEVSNIIYEKFCSFFYTLSTTFFRFKSKLD
ncbi:uncharacterized protein LOC119586607 [Penaeus monodon]|uniref:uncharacterized protein LOC119586607 n=1 Tax=Penaeus monodon TaxID=6687 RepID=UPI0018A75F42|nr:uncharacterized protein LOC119586607 [Penaeus monodon]